MESGMKLRWVMVAAAGALALASCERDEVPPRTKLDAQQAIAAATSAVPGSPQSVRLERRGDGAEYQVMIVPNDGRARVRVEVDANSGQVLKSTPGTRRARDDD